MSRALLIHSGAVGDFILSLRVVEAIRQIDASPISILGRSGYAQLVDAIEGVDTILDLDGKGFHTLFSTDCDLPVEIVEALRPFDLAVNMLGHSGGAMDEQLQRAGVARVINIDPRLRIGWSGHITDQWMTDLHARGLVTVPGSPTLLVEDRRRADGRAALERQTGGHGHHLTILHPGSGSDAKCWPLEQFIRLARLLHEEDRKTVFLLGPVEIEKLSATDMDKLRETAPVVQQLEIGPAAALLSAADLFVGNDSGMSHLAAAVGTRCVAIFGPTDPKHWRPLGEHVRIAYSPPNWPDIGDVLGLV
ncbi:MAG: glycosyltransferase family 9 protein [Phycisphaerales bacterium]|nr:glycosyltransferase family 9 protein [Phycisphaerales bacterium]